MLAVYLAMEVVETVEAVVENNPMFATALRVVALIRCWFAKLILLSICFSSSHKVDAQHADSSAPEGNGSPQGEEAFERCLQSLAFQSNIPYRTEAAFDESNQKLLNRAQLGIDEGDFKRANKSLKKLEKRQLNDFERGLVYYLYGQMAIQEGDYEEALSQYQRISELNENNLPVAFEREVDASTLQLQIRTKSVEEIVNAALGWCQKNVTDKKAAKAFLVNLYGQLGRQDRVAALNAVVSSGEYLPLLKVLPVYPKYAQERGITGYCVVEYVVTATGEVRDPKVIEGLCEPASIFAEPSLEAAAQIKYAPMLIDGVPKEVAGVQNKFTFELIP